ncbi:hypothetical protein BBF96_04435 [Anoxybacter fermentans]|uniref:PqqD family protein n=1 Tax=Anoxybacter fermentans TaxID=1323375 RepID=A0A3S9SWY2_9FIRM|nr:PqqD family peptide modification chaperone [Anoxybacter fermentans]AZR72704.1 hypothetical protein BBF96_04435 [Anoxybacter fermentans]
MKNEKLIAVYPIRLAKISDAEYVLFNTRTFENIYLNDVSFKVWNYINKKKEVLVEEIGKYIISEYGVNDKTVNQICDDLESLFDFFM